MNATEELPRGQQLLLQRLIANHCMSQKEATRIFESLVANGKDYVDDNENVFEEGEGTTTASSASFMGPQINTLEDAFVSINRQLKPGFGLEIITLVDTSGNGAKYYHAVVNTTADEVAKNDTIFSKSWNPHQRAFVRLVMRALVDQSCENQDNNDNDDDDDDDDDHDEDNDDGEDNSNKEKNKKVNGIRRADLINLRSDLENGFKLNLDEATQVVSILLEQKWLRVSASTDSSRRESVQGTIELAPRSYMELYHYITNLGMDEDKLPQFLYHRS